MQSHTPNFDAIKRTNMYGEEYWSARDLAPLLGYTQWRRFEEAIGRAMRTCSLARQDTAKHFLVASKEAEIGSGATRKIPDYWLSRYGLHLVLTHSDLKKPEIAQALAYFTLVSIDANKDYLAPAHLLGVSVPSAIATTKEQQTLGQIMRAFRHLSMVQQYRVSPYRVDLYFPEHRIAVECDEEGHRRYTRREEEKRQFYIEQATGCTFVRFNPDDSNFHIGDVIHEIMMLIYGEGKRNYAKSIA